MRSACHCGALGERALPFGTCLSACESIDPAHGSSWILRGLKKSQLPFGGGVGGYEHQYDLVRRTADKESQLPFGGGVGGYRDGHRPQRGRGAEVSIAFRRMSRLIRRPRYGEGLLQRVRAQSQLPFGGGVGGYIALDVANKFLHGVSIAFRRMSRLILNAPGRKTEDLPRLSQLPFGGGVGGYSPKLLLNEIKIGVRSQLPFGGGVGGYQLVELPPVLSLAWWSQLPFGGGVGGYPDKDALEKAKAEESQLPFGGGVGGYEVRGGIQGGLQLRSQLPFGGGVGGYG